MKKLTVLSLLLLLVFITPGVAETTGNDSDTIAKIHVKPFLHENVDRQKYLDFLDRVESYYHSQNVTVNLVALENHRFNDSESCFQQARFDENDYDKADVAMCVGPGEGGYTGAKTNVVGANTDDPFGFSETGVHAQAHELLHFLGFPDLYHLPLQDDMPRNWMEDDIMTVAFYSDSPTMGKIERKVARNNLRRLRDMGRKEIRFRRSRDHHVDFRKARIPEDTSIEVSFPEASQCRIDEIMNGGEYRKIGRYDVSIFGLDFEMSDFEDNNGFRAVCDDSSKTYWAPFTRLDRCYVSNNNEQPAACELECSNSGNWCNLTGVEDRFQLGDLL